jgi:hypothetical protein
MPGAAPRKNRLEPWACECRTPAEVARGPEYGHAIGHDERGGVDEIAKVGVADTVVEKVEIDRDDLVQAPRERELGHPLRDGRRIERVDAHAEQVDLGPLCGRFVGRRHGRFKCHFATVIPNGVRTPSITPLPAMERAIRLAFDERGSGQRPV